jgi:DNA-binding MarR family transcriptional regulator
MHFSFSIVPPSQPSTNRKAVMADVSYVLGEELICLLQQAAARLSVEMAPALRTHDLALPSWRILAQLWTNGAMRVGYLADRLSLEVSTVSRNVAQLERRGLIARHRSGLDRRASNLVLTAEGRALVDTLAPALAVIQQPLLSGLTSSEQRGLKRLLKRIPKLLNDQSPQREAA